MMMQRSESADHERCEPATLFSFWIAEKSICFAEWAVLSSGDALNARAGSGEVARRRDPRCHRADVLHDGSARGSAYLAAFIMGLIVGNTEYLRLGRHDDHTKRLDDFMSNVSEWPCWRSS